MDDNAPEKNQARGFIDNDLLREVKADTREILGKVGNQGLGLRVETAQTQIIERIALAEKNIIKKIGQRPTVDLGALLMALNEIVAEMRKARGASVEEINGVFEPVVTNLENLAKKN